jgi:hypothetical protein
LNDLFTICYIFKNGGMCIAQLRAQNFEQLKELIIDDLMAMEEGFVSAEDKILLISHFGQFKTDFQIVPIDSVINTWTFLVSIQVEIYIVKTSVLIHV